MIDSGARVNLLDETAYQQLKKPTLSFIGARIHPYCCEDPLPYWESSCPQLHTKTVRVLELFYVVKGQHGSLLSYETATALGLLQVQLNTQENNNTMDRDALKNEFKEVFTTEIGMLKDFKVHLHVNHENKPVKQTHRRIPLNIHVRKEVEQELTSQEEQGIIERVSGPTPWVSPIVVIPKADPSKIRICVDMPPHCTTGCTPASLMFGREVRTKLPQYELPKQNQEARSEKAQTRDKKQMKAAADKQRSSSHFRPISVGDKEFLLHTNPRHTLFQRKRAQ